MPAYNGKAFIAETIASIRSQRHTDYRVVISVDGNDHETADQCRPFLSDPRFSIVLQPERLGWDGNFNWLLSHMEGEFFCYWQQDDLTTEDYLEKLLLAAQNFPAAACFYSDIQWFGDQTDTYVEESVTGLPIERALSIFQTMNGIPNRGLIRRAAIERAGPIASNRHESAFEEYVWIAKLAREGNLQRVPGPIYYKRVHGNTTTSRWHSKPRAWRREVWIEFGLGMLETVWPIVRPEDRLTMFGIVLDRLCNARAGRYMFYDGPTVPFASDFLEAALKQYPVPELSSALNSRERAPRFAGQIGGALMDAVVNWISIGRTSLPATERIASFAVGQAGIDLLSEGWASAEDWGTWSHARAAILQLPPGRGENLKLKFQAFGKPGSQVTIKVAGAGKEIALWQVPALEQVERELSVPADIEQIEFSLPNAVSPNVIGYNQDKRLLGIGLYSLELDR
jgi:GT2 family glycosyltransferase